MLCVLGLIAVGRRFGGNELAATLAFAWVAWPFTQYVSSSNTNDSIQPALLLWGFYAATSQFARGVFVALSSWAKFGSLLVLPLWAGYPEARRPRPAAVFAAGFLLASVLVFSILFLEPSPLHAARVFFDRTIKMQIDRHSPFSLWDWGQYYARGLPDLRVVQHVLEACLVVFALVLGWWPRRRSRAPARGAHRGVARRLRGRAHALVLSLSSVVLPVRRVRAARSPSLTPRECERRRSWWRGRRHRTRRARPRFARRRWRARAGRASR